MFGSLFKKKSLLSNTKEPTVNDLYGDMPQESIFSKIAHAAQQNITLRESSFKFDWSKVPVVKPLEPDYAGLVAFYAYRLALELDTDTMSLMFESSYALKYKDNRRIDRLAANYVFYLFAGLYVAQSIDSSLIEQFIRQYKVNLIQQFIFDKSELATFGVDAAKRGELYFKALNEDKRENTEKFLEGIGKFFIASVVLRAEFDTKKFAQVRDYGTKMFSEFESNLLTIKI
jgi:hypothetical protein